MALDAGPRPARAREPNRRPFLSRRRLRVALLIAAAAIVAGAGLTLLDALRVAHDMRAGRATLAAMVDGGAFGRDLGVRARRGAASFARAQRRAHDSVWLQAIARVPFLGRPSRWLSRVADAGADLSGAAAASARRIEPLLDEARDAGGRIRLLDAVATEFASLRRKTRAVSVGSPGIAVPPFTSVHADLRDALAHARAGLDHGIVAVRGLRSFLTGPTTYLVLAGNNAEMRAGGMVLQAGIFVTRDGDFGAARFRQTSDLGLAAPVPAPAEIARLYGWLDPGSEWRNTGSSPNFPAVAPMYAAMSERAGIGRVDGVMQLDVRALRELLSVVGAVEVRGRRYEAATVERTVMHDLYAVYGERQTRRRNDFSRVAEATFRALHERPWRIERLVTAVRRSVIGRHLMVWSPRPVEQAAWRTLGAAGALDRDGFMVTVQNHGATKLDWFVRPTVEIAEIGGARGGRRWRARIRISNPTPASEPAYIAGDGRKRPRGEYHGLVAVYLPGWASDVEMRGAAVRLVGPDGPMRVIGVIVDVPRGETTSLVVTFSGPPDVRRLVLLPSARAHPVRITVADHRLDDAMRRSLSV